jgi:selenide,water dikinase
VDRISWDGITEAEQLICADAQTSGGLLLAVSPDVAEQVIADLQAAGTLAAARIGTLVDGPPGTIHVRR